MKRAISVLLAAVLTAAVSGIDEVSWAREQQNVAAAEAHRLEIAERLKGIPMGSAIEVQPVSGRKFQALLESVTSDEVTVRLVTGNYAVSRTIPLGEIKNLKRIGQVGGGRHTARNVLIGVGIGAGVFLGVCAAAVRSAGSGTSPSDGKAGGDERS